MKYIELSMLKRGSSGYQVKVLQKLLGDIEIDGIFGSKTEDSIKRYQKNNKLEIDGIVGFETWNNILTKGK